MFQELEQINRRPMPFEFYTASELWTDEHTSEKMLAFHLNENIDVASRKAAFIDRSVDWIVSRFGVSNDTKVADFGCGPGLYAARLARKQAKVTGIDFSKRSIQYAVEDAERSGLSICYVNENYLDFETEERFDLVLMIMCDFCALSPKQRKQMLDKFFKLLKPSGYVLLDVYSLVSFEQREEIARYELNLLDGFWSPNRYYGFLNTFKYENEKVVLDKYTIVEADRLRTVYNWLQYFDPDEIKIEFVESGFEVDEFYSDVTRKRVNLQSLLESHSWAANPTSP
jgi:2-polyprenyl-3-methyl-5-hydroxy-6-metoxy-1,4-benzoquinol methylase